jgi:hypothetical protein
MRIIDANNTMREISSLYFGPKRALNPLLFLRICVHFMTAGHGTPQRLSQAARPLCHRPSRASTNDSDILTANFFFKRTNRLRLCRYNCK